MQTLLLSDVVHLIVLSCDLKLVIAFVAFVGRFLALGGDFFDFEELLVTLVLPLITCLFLGLSFVVA